MRIYDFKLFLMVDDSDTELLLTKAVFHHSYPSIQFRGEKNPEHVLHHVHRAIEAGITPAQICVLLDIAMPRTNGFELIYRLRNDVGTFACCVLMLSASQIHDDRDHSEAIGADGFLRKPFTVEKLERELAHHSRPVSVG